MTSATTWVQALVSNLGWKDARRIVDTHKRPMVGTDQSVRNPHASFYSLASRWIEKHIPPAVKQKLESEQNDTH